MSAPKIMVIRHAEKPETGFQGVEQAGTVDPESLIVQGWQRAGALAALFAPARGSHQDPNLDTPNSLFAATFDPTKHSKRPYETIDPLALKLGLTIDDSHKSSDYADMVKAAIACAGNVLIAWQHEDIPDIGNTIVGNKTTVPQSWPGDRFDVVWVFDYDTTTSGYGFTQVPQLLLAGDSSSPIT